jgi:hypothetical protein
LLTLLISLGILRDAELYEESNSSATKFKQRFLTLPVYPLLYRQINLLFHPK